LVLEILTEEQVKWRGTGIMMTNAMKYKFGNVCERDIDVLLLNSFSVNQGFATLFVNKLNRPDLSNISLVDVELSKVDPTWGESDVTVRLESSGRRYALLIEDKVGAEAQPEQCNRYFRRGKIGIEKKEYEEFFVFICASAEYIATNEEAKHYPYSVSFEELSDYFSKRDDVFSKVRCQQIQQALSFAKVSYKKIVDSKATEFWKSYVEYQRQQYPNLQLPNGSKEKSRNGDWPVYDTQLNRRNMIYIQHKMDRGYVDLTFRGMADRQKELSEFLQNQIGDYEGMGLGISSAGKSAVLRKDVGQDNILSFQKSFEDQQEIAELHFQAIYQLHTIASKLDREELLNLLG
jgi:hypothetical protein